ncbi:MerR family transcriptional regulator [Escherichia coli]|uniref:MerR family transcriptional regulator n=1 Tax=Escherichia coli TaxID=562 RepID=UPI001D4277DD|nr:DNA-binding protein [Escherichia coli]EFN7865570.1 DNA-binding protein [Escherichia coli]EFO0639597.1 DNA-binding protein [Escherichia coli]MCX0000385.1 DNA-binding protein [Escherichia coli]QMH91304.1 DNA-binding protein [Escherichia coli]
MMSFEIKEWFNAKELEGMPGVPKLATNITRKAVAEDWVKRQRHGGKGVAYEYHINSLPEETRRAIKGASLSDKPVHTSIVHTVDERLIYAMSFLTPDEQAAAVEIIRIAGIKGLMPTIVSKDKALEALGITVEQQKTLQTLQALPPEKVREILSQYEGKEHNFPVRENDVKKSV